MTIPIRNLYYLFCYAWQRFPAGDAVETGVDTAPDILNLFAQMLTNGANRLIRRGLDRGYRTFVEEERAPRGKMLMDAIVKGQTLRRGAVVCAFDELTADVLHNQIIKATVRSLACTRGITADQAHALRLIVQRMAPVADIRPTASTFHRVQLSRNTSQYGPMLKLCEFIFHGLMPDTDGTTSRFADILKDETIMSAVFEDFLRNFFSHEQKAYRVSREIMNWDATPLDETSLGFLPIMETDITLRSRERAIVMDAKFYADILASRKGPGKVRSSHLYQLFAYLEHAGRGLSDFPCDGALIYPSNGTSVCLRYNIRGHEVLVRSVDLTRPWQEIHADLLAIPGSFTQVPAAHLRALA